MIERDGPGAVTLGAGDRVLAVAAVKAVLRVVSSEEDALIGGLAETALGLAEHFTGRVMIARALRDIVPVSRAWQRLAAAPVRSIGVVEALTGVGTGAASVVLGASAYAVDIDAAGAGWVRVVDGGAGATTRIAVSFTAGVADGWATVPSPLRQGVALLAAHLFSERDERAAPPAAVTALWRPFRCIALLPERRLEVGTC